MTSRSPCPFFSRSLLVLLACTAGCGAGQARPQASAPVAAAPAAPAAADGAQLMSRLRALAGQGGCTDTAQCHTVAVGAKACGGPEAYLPWSGADPATAPQVAALAAQFTAARRALNQAAPAMASDCRLVPDPGALCVKAAPAAAAGKCVLRPSGTGDPA